MSARGGARPGSGRPVADIQLDQERARMLKLIIQARGISYNKESASAMVMALIDVEWERLDTGFVADMDDAGDVIASPTETGG